MAAAGRVPEPLWALLCYCLASISMTVLNKLVLSALRFPMNFLLLFVQSLASVLLLALGRRCGLLHFRGLNARDAQSCTRPRL
jgi:GDP-mannose transporter